MASTSIKQTEKISCSRDLDFVKIVEDQRPEKKDENENEEENLVYYCKDCKDIIEIEIRKRGKKEERICKNCSGFKITKGTPTTLKKYYKF